MATPPPLKIVDVGEVEDADEEGIIISKSVEMEIMSDIELENILTNYQTTTIVNIVPHDELTNLLKNWDQLELLDQFKKEGIDIDVLKNIECHHLERVLRPFTYRTLIMFEAKLREWRHSIGKPLLMFSNAGFRPIASSQCSSRASSPYVSRQNVINSPSTPRSSKSPNPPNSISLGEILNSNPKTLALAEDYDKSNKFQEHQRKQLIDTIASYFDQNKIHLDLHSSYKIETEIAERFPTEKLEYYRTGKRGKIYNKYCNIKSSSKMNTMEASTTSSPSTSAAKNKTPETPSSDIVAEEDAEHTYRALKYDNLSLEEFDRCWKACINHRLLQIKNASSTSEIFTKWPQYKLPTGHRLIDIDFSQLYQNSGSFLNKWGQLVEKLLRFLSTENHVKEKSIREILKKIESTNPSENCKDAALLWALHGYFVPFQKVFKKDKEGHKHVTRYTIKDSQNSFIWVGKTIQAIEEHIAFLNKMAENVQPFIIVHGDSILNFSDIFLYFDGVKFIFKSFIRAVDICFKIFYLFNLQYPIACSSFWGFIETQYFKRNKKEICAKTHVLLNEIL